MSDVHDNIHRYSYYKANFNNFRHRHSLSMALLLSSFVLSFSLFLFLAILSTFLLKKEIQLFLFLRPLNVTIESNNGFSQCFGSNQYTLVEPLALEMLMSNMRECLMMDLEYTVLCFRGTGTHIQACLRKQHESLLRKNEASVVMYSIYSELNEKGQQGCLTY